MFISISCLQLSHFAEISGPYIPLQHRMGGPSGMYYCGQTSLNHHTYTTPEELYWSTLNLDTDLHLLPQHLHCLHTISVYDKIPFWLGGSTQLTITTKEIWGSLCVMLAEWMMGPTLLIWLSLHQKKTLPMLLKGSSSWEPDLHFFRGHYSSWSWIYIKAMERMQQKTSWK